MAKLILTQEVSGLGAAGDIVDVKDGYARNYLLPRGYALAWTKGGEKDVERIRAARKSREIATVEEAQAVAEKLQSQPVKVSVKTGESGRLFGTVGAAQIAEAVEAAGLGSIDKRTVEIPERIKAVGSYAATVKLHSDVTASIDLQVVAGK
ncbi:MULTISPECIES: 50S ribosomal protein L9 [Nesterenkonia]|uniref:Large ribosomal subunit protein bL9 n=1 Tax=Nesterenkonia xinjiangensis TaxID=225327 RepID=A0A7Z0GL13_9MICC|nr:MULTISPECIES: 50S ribosomal protein L9 [Nesterenkonia]MDZ5077350.1 50S ribosomal protein L9 [Nesterenkonia sp. HG001]NYJ77972.1 large subunit ribosomal protein L9 [Nesterenkonia xinjiangensis]